MGFSIPKYPDFATKGGVVFMREQIALEDGDLFYAQGVVAVPATSTQRWLLRTPALPTLIYLWSDVDGVGGTGTFEAYEDPTVTATGAVLGPGQNMNRNSADVATLQLWENPTVTATGTPLMPNLGGFAAYWLPILLKADSYYLMQWVETGVGSAVTLEVQWMELP